MFWSQAPYNAAAYAVTVTFATTTNSVLYAWSFFTWRLVFKTTRFVVSLYVLYELRHPSVFPDEKTKFKKASNASGDETGEIKKASRPNEAAPNSGRGGRVGDVNDPANKAAHANDGKEIGVGSTKSDPATGVSSESPGRKKSKAELEAEAERERRRAARAMKKAERKKQKEAEDAAKRARAEGADVIDNRPLAPLNALFRIPSKAYQVL